MVARKRVMREQLEARMREEMQQERDRWAREAAEGSGLVAVADWATVAAAGSGWAAAGEQGSGWAVGAAAKVAGMDMHIQAPGKSSSRPLQ